jgi:Ca-activated chloride channel family protein
MWEHFFRVSDQSCMKSKSSLALLALFLALLHSAPGDGFIVIHEPVRVPPGHFPFAPLEVSRHHVDVKIDNQVAVTSVDEAFYNPNDRALEGVYMFPVPKGAHIDKFSIEIGGKLADAELLPADKARQIYEDIVRKMRDPALLEYAERDLFKVRIFPIEPRKDKQVKITYTELLRSDSGTLTYLYPLGTEKFSAQPIRSLSVKVDLKSDKPLASIYSPSHKVEIKRDGASRAIIGFEADHTKPDTDFELVFAPESRELGLTVMTHKPDAGDGYFLLLAAPTLDNKETKPAAKDVAFVLDTSGSMAGAKLKQAKHALEFCIENLNADDRFEIVRFSTEAEPLFDKLVDATAENRKHAADFIHDLKPNGGTAIADALQRALKLRAEKSGRPFVVIFLTDGLPTVGATKDDDILAIARKAGAGARIFSFGIGSDVNTHLLDQIAETSRAFSQYVLAEEDIEVKVSNFFARIKEPALTNLRLEFSDAVHTSKIYPADLPDLFKGDQLVLTGRYSGSGEVTATLTGMAGGREQKFTYKVRFDDHNTGREFIPRLWATRRVGFLLDEIRLHGESAELRDETTALARQYGIVTPYTAYLIVEDEDRRNVPLAQRSMQEMSSDMSARSRVGEAWGGFKDKKSGEDSVANAQSQNHFKYADQGGASIASGNKEVFRGLVAAAPAAKAEAGRLEQYTQQSKFVNGRAFFQNGKQWMDGNSQNATKRQRVQFNSTGYFDLLREHPETAPWLALGQNVLLTIGDTAYEIFE